MISEDSSFEGLERRGFCGEILGFLGLCSVEYVWLFFRRVSLLTVESNDKQKTDGECKRRDLLMTQRGQFAQNSQR